MTLGRFRDAVEMRHEPREVFQATPEAPDIGDGPFHSNCLADMHSASAAKRRLRVVGLYLIAGE
jgi:hypothetical protein